MNVPSLKQDVSDTNASLKTPSPSKEFEDLIYLISHDVRASVRALIELPQWIVEDLTESGVKINDSVAESIDLMNTHTGRLDRMLVDLLAFSRVARMQEVSEVELDFVLTEVLDEMRIPQGFKVVPTLDANTVTMGERDVLTMFTALLSNAVKHHDKDSGEISVYVGEQQGSLCIEVTDDGPGIPERFSEKVFDAMTTLRPRDEVEGSGMGLAIVRKIVSVYGGHVSIAKTESSRGTTVRILLPRHQT